MPENIKSRFEADFAAAQGTINLARKCAALTKPATLPPDGQSPDSELPETYQSDGPLGTTNLEGKSQLALYPPDQPWVELIPDPEVWYSPNVSDQQKQAIAQQLFVRELLIQTVLESAGIEGYGNRRPAGFRSQKRMVISQVLITGDALEQITDDYRVKVFRRDQYVTKRDTAMDVLYHVIKECIDPLSLSEPVRRKARFEDEELKKKPASERLADLYTQVEWQPLTKRWLITQEINNVTLNDAASEEEISPFISTPFDLVPGENYGRPYVGLLRGSLRSLDNLCEKRLDFAAMASMMHPVYDYACQMRPKDFAKPSGTPWQCKVVQGQAQDIGIFRADKGADFAVVESAIASLQKELGKAFLMESESTPRGERVTAYQVQRVAQELEGALGGLYTPLADYQQIPTAARVNYMLERDHLAAPLPKEAFKIRARTGIAALGRAQAQASVLSLTDVLAKIPDALRRVDVGVLISLLARYNSIYQPGLIKSDEKLAQETQAAIAAQTQMAAAQKGVDVTGNLIENSLTPAAA